MDPFEVRMHFLTLLRKLNASQQSIQKVVGYALKYFPRCGEDLWDCIVEECQKGSVNNRINILYFLDSLCESSLLAKAQADLSYNVGSSRSINSNIHNSYVDFVARDLGKIVEYVVPEGRQGLPNLTSTKQILENWRSKRVIDPQKIDEVVGALSARKSTVETQSSTNITSPPTSLPRSEIFKRIEEDRERHKRLRERRWVQPVSHLPPSYHLAAFLPLTDDKDGTEELTLDIEFENEWDATSDWNEDDIEAVIEEIELCSPAQGRHKRDGSAEQRMDLS